MVQHIRDHADDFAPFLEERSVEEYAENMSKDAAWGSDLELQVIAQLQHTSFTVLSMLRPPLTFAPPEPLLVERGTDPAFHALWFSHGSHWDALYSAAELKRRGLAARDVKRRNVEMAQHLKQRKAQEADDLKMARQVARLPMPATAQAASPATEAAPAAAEAADHPPAAAADVIAAVAAADAAPASAPPPEAAAPAASVAPAAPPAPQPKTPPRLGVGAGWAARRGVFGGGSGSPKFSPGTGRGSGGKQKQQGRAAVRTAVGNGTRRPLLSAAQRAQPAVAHLLAAGFSEEAVAAELRQSPSVSEQPGHHGEGAEPSAGGGGGAGGAGAAALQSQTADSPATRGARPATLHLGREAKRRPTVAALLAAGFAEAELVRQLAQAAQEARSSGDEAGERGGSGGRRGLGSGGSGAKNGHSGFARSLRLGQLSEEERSARTARTARTARPRASGSARTHDGGRSSEQSEHEQGEGRPQSLLVKLLAATGLVGGGRTKAAAGPGGQQGGAQAAPIEASAAGGAAAPESGGAIGSEQTSNGAGAAQGGSGCSGESMAALPHENPRAAAFEC